MDKLARNRFPKEKIILVIAILLTMASFSFDGYVFWNLRKENLALKEQVGLYDDALKIAQKNFQKTSGEKDAVTTLLTAERQNSTIMQSQIQDITSTVGQLKKLSETDVELLKKYSKIYFLNENYVPLKLSDLDPKYLNNKNKQVQVHTDILPHLIAMLESVKSQGIEIQILSGYRSFATQASLKSDYKTTYGSGANKFSADQGYSEHQLGTTLDFTTEKIGAVLTGFDKTEGYKWLSANAYKYGFILSYPKSNTYYIYEPWHWRYVGVALATKLHDQNINFYDASQRDIDQYLANIFD
jgi:LAS superfamily LD-carboxypeptidase LdcB